VATFAKRTVN